MKMDLIAGSGNDEFYTPRYAVEPLLKYLPGGAKVWCPFDTPESVIVRTLRETGWEVFNTHIATGHDFFAAPQCFGDVIVSNPPYSLKYEVFERLFAYGVPFAMLVGVVGLFEAKRFHLFKDKQFEIMWLSKRVSYFKSFDDEKPALNPPFSSVWITSKLLPRGNVFEEIRK